MAKLTKCETAAVETVRGAGAITPSFMGDDGADWPGPAGVVCFGWKHVASAIRKGALRINGVGVVSVA